MVQGNALLHVAKMTGAAGMENHLLLLLPGLRQRGLDVRLVVLTEPDKPMTAYLAEMNRRGVPAESMTIARDFDPALIRRLARKLRTDGITALHTHLIHADLHGWLAAKLAGVKRLYSSAHNDDGFRKLLPVRLFQAFFWRQMTAGIAISEALRQFLIKTEFAPAQKIQTIHYGFDSAEMPVIEGIREKFRTELGIPADAVVFGSVCRLVEQKGLIYALRAFASARRTWQIDAPAIRDAHYVIVGDGPLRKTLEAEAGALGIADHLHFTGWREDARALYPAFDVFMMPSLWEGFGLVALEAMAAGLPILASNVSALPEIVVNGETGYLAAPRDVETLAARLKRIADDPTAAREMGQRGRDRLEREFAVDKMVERTAAVYGDGGVLRVP